MQFNYGVNYLAEILLMALFLTTVSIKKNLKKETGIDVDLKKIMRYVTNTQDGVTSVIFMAIFLFILVNVINFVLA